MHIVLAGFSSWCHTISFYKTELYFFYLGSYYTFVGNQAAKTKDVTIAPSNNPNGKTPKLK